MICNLTMFYVKLILFFVLTRTQLCVSLVVTFYAFGFGLERSLTSQADAPKRSPKTAGTVFRHSLVCNNGGEFWLDILGTHYTHTCLSNCKVWAQFDRRSRDHISTVGHPMRWALRWVESIFPKVKGTILTEERHIFRPLISKIPEKTRKAPWGVRIIIYIRCFFQRDVSFNLRLHVHVV
jgi:hypothetical protein